MLPRPVMRVIAAGLLALIGGIAPASADEVWTQSVQRASTDATCSGIAADAGWSSWAPTWEQWPNGRRGGFTCQRSITWARSAPQAPSPEPPSGCTFFTGGQYVIVVNDFEVEAGGGFYVDSACTTRTDPPNTTAYMMHTSDVSLATATCRSRYFADWIAMPAFAGSTTWWTCSADV